ncbi:unnamed protein product [Penicillium bialowiezense]
MSLDLTANLSLLFFSHSLSFSHHFQGFRILKFHPKDSERIAPDGDLILYASGQSLQGTDTQPTTQPTTEPTTTEASFLRRQMGGYVELAIIGCKPHTLLLILNAIHGRARKLPREISLEKVAEAAVAVDYYQCAEALELARKCGCLLVSSAHLNLASLFFRTLFSTRWSGALAPTAGSPREVALHEVNPNTLAVIMNVIHGQTRKIPQGITLGELVEFATMADFFQCAEAVELAAKLWMRALKLHIPSYWTADIPKWIMV